MIRHLLKMVWHRKRANALVAIEIFFSFLVIFAVVTGAAALWAGWRQPLGYEWKDVWMISIGGGSEDVMATGDDPMRETIARVLAETKAFPQVAAAGLSSMPPLSGMSSEGSWNVNGRRFNLTRDEVTDGFADAMQMKVVRGRWLNASDDALNYRPVVIDSDLAEAMFGDEDPVGQKFDDVNGVVDRVVGVVPPYRKSGEFSAPHVNMVFFRKSLAKANGHIPNHLLVRVRPGTPAEFEAQLMQHLHRVMPEVSMDVRRLEQMRESSNRARSSPIAVLAIIALFLISMVALGLTGVLWQNVTRRTRELGLRRAVGASATTVRRQVLLEVALLATLAVIIDLIVVLQLPLLGIFALFTPAVFTAGIIVALVVIYGITLASGLYPSWLASRLTPAEALRYE
ncbi:MAG TPA: ABC transporter permease [Thermoanaerobaculia bacterium]|nr:ABC transporter permease [Thermoanaerobaculia bacterium]